MGRTPFEAVNNYIRPLEEALHCITEAPLAFRRTRNLEVEKVYVASLGEGASVRLKGVPLRFHAAQMFKIIENRPDQASSKYRVTTAAYVYEFTESGDKQQEVLTFHWNPDDPTPGMVRFSHLHIGPALLINQTVLRPKDLHHAHIPTGRVSLESVVRLAITEFGVTPLKSDWETILATNEEAFDQNRTR